MMSYLNTHPFKNQFVLFWHWWTTELLDLLPSQIINIGKLKKQNIILIQVDDKFLTAHLEDDDNQLILERFNRSGEGFELLAAHINKIRERRPKTNIGLHLKADDCLIRHLEYPLAAKAKIQDILQLDLEQKTPFKAEEIYTDFTCNHSSLRKNTLEITQLIVKKHKLDEIITNLKTFGITASFADALNKDSSEPYKIDFLKDPSGLENGESNKLGVLFIAMIGLIGLTMFLIFSRQESALQELSTKTLELQKKAKAIQNASKQATLQSQIIHDRMNIKLRRYSAVEVWSELTKRLPDDVWLTELQIRDNIIRISGLAGSAANLIKTLNASPMFKKSRLIAQVRMEAKLNKERFSLETRLNSKLAENKRHEINEKL